MPSQVTRRSGAAAEALAVALTLILLSAMLAHECTTSEAACAIVRRRSLLAVPGSIAFAGAATFLRGVTPPGAIAGWAIALILWLSAGAGGFLTLVSVFVVTWLSTRFGHARKLAAGIAESRRGRSAMQVIANLGVAALAAAFGGAYGIVACVAALAEAAADTVSSEIGQATSGHARLLVTFRTVPAGTDGAVTLAGTVAGITAAALVAATTAFAGLLTPGDAAMAALAGALGMMCDSFLGATVERRGWLGNNAVNALSTAFAAALAAAWLWPR